MNKLSLAGVLLLSACAAAQPSVPPSAPTAPPLHDAVEVVADGFKFTEGPAVGPGGAVYFTDMPPQRIMRFDPASGATTTFREDSGRANGLFFQDGHLYACEGGRRRVAVYRAGDAGALAAESEALATAFAGQPFNQPNDLAVDAQGGVYFTDPHFRLQDDPAPPAQGVYYAASPQDEPVLVSGQFERPNGVALSPDGRRLFVQDVQANLIYVAQGGGDGPGSFGPFRVFADVSDAGVGEQLGRPDGMCIDAAGNVYTALFRGGAVVVHNAAGKRLQQVVTGPQTTNCVIGPGGKYLYVTAEKSLKRIPIAR